MTRSRTVVKLDGDFTWVFDGPDIDQATVSELLERGKWHIAARTRTRCGKRVQLQWRKAQKYRGYRGPAIGRRCPACQAWLETQGRRDGTEEPPTKKRSRKVR